MLNIEERAKMAQEAKLSGKLNCAQAVLLALKEDSNLDDATLKNIGAGFCAGMGNMEATCGALIGANIVLGIKTNGYATIKLSKQLIEEFKAKSGATKCKELKQMTDGKPLCPCDICVKNAVLAYGKVLGLDK